MAMRNHDLRKFPWLGSVGLVLVLVGLTFGLTYLFLGNLFLGDPIPTLAPGVYDVVAFHQGEREFLFWLKQKDTEEPAQYHIIPSRIVVVEKSLLYDNDVLEVIKERNGWSRVNLFVDP